MKMGQILTKKDKNNKEMLKFQSKKWYFIQNGGILQEKQIALRRGQDTGAGQLEILSSKDIQKAIHSCNSDDVSFGRSTSITVYKGILDDRIVAIKTPQEMKTDTELIDLFLTEASAGMVMNHSNMVKLYACCLETYIPMLVYEFLPRGDFFEYLHGKFAITKTLRWADYLGVLTDVSYALSYMHNALSEPVVHRNVSSQVILLDESFHAKLANFAYSVSVTPGDKSQRWPVEGTPGYIDPEYIETHEVTDKCDVYSFGVLMLETLTRRQPAMMARSGISLVDVFVSAVQRNCMMEMINNEVLEQASWDEIEQVAQLALQCVETKGVERPIMVEVVSKFWQIQGQHSK